MNFIVVKYYIRICKIIRVQPSFEGLKKFQEFYIWECEYNGRGKMGKDINRNA